MFGWLKRLGRDGGRLVQLASASAGRRANRNATCEDDMNALLDHALRLATFFLEGGRLPAFLPVRDGFPPFGAGINPKGDVVDFNCLPSPGSTGMLDVFCIADQLALFAEFEQTPSPQQWHEPPPVAAVAHAMTQCASAGGLHVAALIDEANDSTGHWKEMGSAIRVRLEHVEVDPITWYLPYRVADRKLVRGELTRVAGQSLVFAE